MNPFTPETMMAVAFFGGIAALVVYSYYMTYWFGYSKGRTTERDHLTAKQNDAHHWERWDDLDTRLDKIEGRLGS